MDMSQELISKIASMLTGDPNVVVKAQVDDAACPVSEHDVPSDGQTAEVMVVGQDADDYGVPAAACGETDDSENDCDANNMNLANAEKLHMVGAKISEILKSGCDLDAWMEQKLTICRAYASDILNALEFKHKHHQS